MDYIVDPLGASANDCLAYSGSCPPFDCACVGGVCPVCDRFGGGGGYYEQWEEGG
jgi:hypothetical protein